jgi:hypothetical protein
MAAASFQGFRSIIENSPDAISLIHTSACISAERKTNHAPQFEDYPVTETLKGKPVPPQIVRQEEQAASTIIRDGVERGKGVKGRDGKERPGPNIAGHYIVIEWGDGPDYWQAAIVDALTGRIFQPPFAGQGGPHASYFSIPMDPFGINGTKFRLNSKLMVLPRACPNQAVGCSEYYLLWQQNHWTPLN